MVELSKQERLHRAEEADRILNDDLCKEVMSDIRSDALNKLSIVDADNKNEIIRLQAVVQVVDSFQDGLSNFKLDADGLNEKSGPI